MSSLLLCSKLPLHFNYTDALLSEHLLLQLQSLSTDNITSRAVSPLLPSESQESSCLSSFSPNGMRVLDRAMERCSLFPSPELTRTQQTLDYFSQREASLLLRRHRLSRLSQRYSVSSAKDDAHLTPEAMGRTNDPFLAHSLCSLKSPILPSPAFVATYSSSMQAYSVEIDIEYNEKNEVNIDESILSYSQNILSPCLSTVPALLPKETSNTPKLVQYIRSHSLERKLSFESSNSRVDAPPPSENLRAFLQVSPPPFLFL